MDAGQAQKLRAFAANPAAISTQRKVRGECNSRGQARFASDDGAPEVTFPTEATGDFLPAAP